MSDELKLLVEWSDPWEEFRTAVRPALGRSPTPLAGEAHTGLFPYRGMASAWALEVFLLAVAIVLPAKIASMRPYEPKLPPKYDVLYFTGDELPRTEDLGGAQAGTSGRAGGKEAFHRTQTIRVARGSSAVNTVVDAPNIKLPVSMSPVANLLAVNKLPGPAPAEGLRPTREAPTFSKDAIVAPPPQVLQKLTRSTPSLAETVIAPPPSNVKDRERTLAGLSTPVIAPPPDDTTANRKMPMSGLPVTVISPAPDVSHQQDRALVAMNTPIVPPPVRDPSRELPALTGPETRTRSVVPPPVTAPERITTTDPKLTLPAPAVIAPPPSQIVRDQREVTGVALGDPRKVVPPPVQPKDQVHQPNLAGMLGAAQVVPPPPNLGSGSSLSGSGGGMPNQHGVAGGTLGAREVIPPPPSVGGSGSLSGSGRGQGASLAGSLSNSVVPPPPNAGGAGMSRGTGKGEHGGLGGSLSAGNVVPPPPNLGAGSGLSGGRGTGSKGGGLGGPMDAGSVSAPPGGGGSGKGAGLIVGAEPGSSVGRPGSGGMGSIALSPSGGKEPGLGGNGGGNGIGTGNGPGSGLSGEGSGSGKSGSGKGADPNAHGGISPYPGPGGAGSATEGQPSIPGVSVQGGNTITLPSFGGGNGNDPNLPVRSNTASSNHDFDVTIVATSRSGGAFNNYHLAKGAKTYTKYFQTAAGMVSMQYWNSAGPARLYTDDLVAPEPMNTEISKNVGSARLVIFCILDRNGVLKDLRVSEAGTPEMAAKVMAALPTWKFRPAFRGNEPIEVNAILGFNIDTSR